MMTSRCLRWSGWQCLDAMVGRWRSRLYCQSRQRPGWRGWPFLRGAKSERTHCGTTGDSSIPRAVSVVAQAMITDHQVQRSPEECCRHLLLEVVLTACSDWLACRERNWRPSKIKGKFPAGNDVAELRMFFAEGWIDRLLHMAGSSLCGDRILSALARQPRDDFAKTKQADRTSESHMLHGSDDITVMTGATDVLGHVTTDIGRACSAWLERREPGYQARRSWRSLADKDFNLRHQNQNQ